MLGPIIIVAIVLLVLPPGFLIAGLVFSAVLDWLIVSDAEERAEGSELIDLNT